MISYWRFLLSLWCAVPISARVYRRYENRYYRHARLNLSVTFHFLKVGQFGIRGHHHAAGGAVHRALGGTWRYKDVAAFLREIVAPAAPSILVLNVGIWWFRQVRAPPVHQSQRLSA